GGGVGERGRGQSASAGPGLEMGGEGWCGGRAGGRPPAVVPPADTRETWSGASHDVRRPGSTGPSFNGVGKGALSTLPAVHLTETGMLRPPAAVLTVSAPYFIERTPIHGAGRIRNP